MDGGVYNRDYFVYKIQFGKHCSNLIKDFRFQFYICNYLKINFAVQVILLILNKTVFQ